MKKVLVKDLKVGDVFIDGDMYSVMESDHRVLLSPGRYKLYVKVKCIVGPTVQIFYPGVCIKPNTEYYLPLNKTVQLCEGTLE